MYVTQLYFGKPYQAYIPDSIRPKAEFGDYEFWQQLDLRLLRTSMEQEFSERMPSVVNLNYRSKIATVSDKIDSSAALRTAFLAEKVNEREIKTWNRLLTNSSFLKYREGIGFIGSSDPTLAWHVGCPKEKIPVVMARLLSFQSSLMPASYVAIVSIMRMLAIHPFVDGNGRTARLYSAWLVRKSLAPSPLFLDIVESLWDRERMNLHHAAEIIKTEENWSYLFGSVKRCVEVNARQY